MTLVGMASADITGTFVPAENTVNTFLSSDGTSSMANPASTGVLWRDSVSANYHILGSFAYEPNSTDAEIVTTITGLVAGDDYSIDVVFGDLLFSSTYSLDAGFVSGNLTHYADGSADDTGMTAVSSVSKIHELTIGTSTADVDGEIEVFLGPSSTMTGRYIYNGLAFTNVSSVPEPSSLALLGLLGGLGLIRRR